MKTDDIIEFICEEKHTNYQPNGKNWHCPNCKEVPISINIISSMNEKCEELHNEDEVKCMLCGYTASGKNMTEKLLEETDLVICPTCDGERMVSHKTIPKNISDDSNEKMLIGKTISNITREIIEQDYGDHTVITLIFTDGTKHGFVLPIDEE